MIDSQICQVTVTDLGFQSLFGMNIDILASNPSWWLYIPFSVGTILLTLSIWILFKSKAGVSVLVPIAIIDWLLS
jgi:hypothetical protein